MPSAPGEPRGRPRSCRPVVLHAEEPRTLPSRWGSAGKGKRDAVEGASRPKRQRSSTHSRGKLESASPARSSRAPFSQRRGSAAAGEDVRVPRREPAGVGLCWATRSKGHSFGSRTEAIMQVCSARELMVNDAKRGKPPSTERLRGSQHCVPEPYSRALGLTLHYDQNWRRKVLDTGIFQAEPKCPESAQAIRQRAAGGDGVGAP